MTEVETVDETMLDDNEATLEAYLRRGKVMLQMWVTPEFKERVRARVAVSIDKSMTEYMCRAILDRLERDEAAERERHGA